MGNVERADLDVTNSETLTATNGLDASEALLEPIGQGTVKGIKSGLGDVKRRFPQAEHLRQAVAVIGVFVGDEDAVDVLDGSLNSRESGERFALAETGVNEEAGPLGLEQCNVARTT